MGERNHRWNPNLVCSGCHRDDPSPFYADGDECLCGGRFGQVFTRAELEALLRRAVYQAQWNPDAGVAELAAKLLEEVTGD